MKENVSTTSEKQRKNPPQAGFTPNIKAKIMAKWSRISESDVDAMNGSFSALTSKIQEVYSYPKAKAESECVAFKKFNKLT